MNKRTSLFALAAMMAAFAGNQAMAADLAPPPPPAPEIRASVSDWTGPYMGALLGGTCMETRTEFTTYDNTNNGALLERFPVDTNGCGFTGGVMAGFNYQIDNIVFGVEGDWTWGGKTGEHVAQHYAYDVDPATGQLVVTGRKDQEENYNIDWMASLRMRAGILATDNTLFYFTGGLSWLRGEMLDVGSGKGFTNTHIGYVLGGGIEHALTENIHLRGEYLFSSYNRKTYGRYCADPSVCDVAVDVDPKMSQFHTFRMGVSWNFPISSW